jgi:hypothetical protein
MIRHFIPLLIAPFLFLSGCAATKETAEKKECVPKSIVGKQKAEVEKILSRPDYMSSSGDETIFFYCTYLVKDTSKGICTPIVFKDDIVVEVGEKDAQKWTLDMVQSEFAAGRVEKVAKTDKKLLKIESSGKPPHTIAEETLLSVKTYIPQKGDTAYVNYHSNFVRYIQLREDPSDDGKVLKILCIGNELEILMVQDGWLFVKGTNMTFAGWILEQWVTDDRSVMIDAEKKRVEHAPEIARLEAKVKPIPVTDWKRNLQFYEKLLELDPCNLLYQRKVEFYVNYGRKAKKRRR